MNTTTTPTPSTTCVALAAPKDNVLITGPTGAVVLVTVQADRRLQVDVLPAPATPQLPAESAPTRNWMSRAAAAVAGVCSRTQRQRD